MHPHLSPKGSRWEHWSVGFLWRERKRKRVNGQAWDIFNLYMFFHDMWAVSAKKKKSCNVEEDLIILWRCRNVGQLTMSDRVLTLSPPLNQSLAILGCKCHRFRKTARWECLHRGGSYRWKPPCTRRTPVHSAEINCGAELVSKGGVGTGTGCETQGGWAGTAADGAERVCLGWNLSALQGKHRPSGTWQAQIRNKVLLQKLGNSQVP